MFLNSVNYNREKSGAASPKKPLRTKRLGGVSVEEVGGKRPGGVALEGRSQSMREISSTPSLGTTKGTGEPETKVGHGETNRELLKK